ncbi:MAG TPA: DUF402 domain-containing protein [Mycobacteriales bacterium]|nr:DUF402 domain-containing protein [Mycobacteriales bacterium]
MAWSYGDTIVRREVLDDGRPWEAMTVYVVDDSDDQLVVYLPEGAELGFLEGEFPTESGGHPWNRGPGTRWVGHGVLMVHRPGEDHALWHFWSGPDRAFEAWYVNIQEAFRRTPIGFDTRDLELDIVVPVDGDWYFKDREKLAGHVERGHFTAEQVERVVALGDELGAELAAGRRWWDEKWASWAPEPSWRPVPLPQSWAGVPVRAALPPER